MMQDTECKTCKTKLEWTGSVTGGHMACPNKYCSTNKSPEMLAIKSSNYPTAEDLEYDAADD
ncbi:hypothetical protein D3C78_1578390 [compost metagenome]